MDADLNARSGPAAVGAANPVGVAVALAFACAVVYGIADYGGGRAARTAPSIIVSLYGQAASGLLAITVVVLLGTALPPRSDVYWGAVAGVASAIALAAFYHALSRGAMTVVAPVTAMTSAIVPVVFGLLRGERPAGLAYLGMAIAVAAVALVSGAMGQHGVVTSRSTFAFALVAGLGFAAILIALGETSKDGGIWSLVVARAVSVSLLVVLVLVTRTAITGHGPTWRLAAFAGVLDITANLLYLAAERRGLLSVVVVIVALYPVSTVCLAFGLDNERVSRSQAVGMGLALGALLLVSISGSS